jgi:ArsR family transcriptional regulator
MGSLDRLLNGFRAAAESTRLRVLSLCAEGELTVTELTHILGQSQPRVSRHLKVLCEGGLLERHQERTWVFYRLAELGREAAIADSIIALLPDDDPTLALDRERLAAVKQARAERAGQYFRDNAADWDRIRALHVNESEVEGAMSCLFNGRNMESFLDIGTGTGRILEMMAAQVERGIGIDLSHEMLALARVRLEAAGHRHCQVRQGDMYNLPFAADSFDGIAFHMVLHFADNPVGALAEAARVLRPGGRLVLVDFAPHELEFLRDEQAHRRLGFAPEEVTVWCAAAGLQPSPPLRLVGAALTVLLWAAHAP